VGLRDEILEQPEVATRFLRDGLPQVRRIADALDGRELDVVLIAARGTSDHAAIYAQYLFGALHRLPVSFVAWRAPEDGRSRPLVPDAPPLARSLGSSARCAT